METELKLLFPTVMKYKMTETRFVGIFKSQQNENIFASFNVPNYPNAAGITFESAVNLNEQTYQSLISQSDNINFLEFLKLFNQAMLTAPKQKFFNRKFYYKFYHEFRLLKQRNPTEKFVFSNNEILSISCVDDFGVKNKIFIKMNFYDDSEMYEVVKYTFPEPKDIKLFHKQLSLQFIHKQFLKYVKDLGTFHDTIQKIDSVCWVISPKNPSYSYDYRTIIIGENNMSVKITFNPWGMSSIPDFQFFGPSNVVQDVKNKFSENISSWSTDCDIIQNILKVLDLPFFPVKPEEDQNKTLELYDSNSECCVCFSFYLNEEVPNVTCENNSCRRQFHNECLYEWLSRLPDCREIQGEIRGECPNCEKMISCKVPTK